MILVLIMFERGIKFTALSHGTWMDAPLRCADEIPQSFAVVLSVVHAILCFSLRIKSLSMNI